MENLTEIEKQYVYCWKQLEKNIDFNLLIEQLYTNYCSRTDIEKMILQYVRTYEVIRGYRVK